MKLFYFKSNIGNFGDDLNPWLWNKIFGDLESYQANIEFIGVGSILDNRIKSSPNNVVFGSGVRSFNPLTNLKESEFIFVRGPISSKVLGGVPFITDSAYCLGLLPEYKKTQIKKYKCSIIPYFRHLDKFNWEGFCIKNGFNFINVTDPVEEVIKQINESEKVIAGAMHGAIIADVLRVPWVRLRFGKHGYESAETSELKWNDWMLSMELFDSCDLLNIRLAKFSKRNRLFNFLINLEVEYKVKGKIDFSLSGTNVLNFKLDELSKAVENFKQIYATK